RRLVFDGQPGVALRQVADARGCCGVVRLHEDRADEPFVRVAGHQLGCDQGVAESQRARGGGADLGLRPRSVAAHDVDGFVEVLNSSVQLIAIVRTSGVLADEKRRVAVARLADARKPPTGEIDPRMGLRKPATMRATTGPRKPTAVTRNIAVISEVAAAVAG